MCCEKHPVTKSFYTSLIISLGYIPNSRITGIKGFLMMVVGVGGEVHGGGKRNHVEIQIPL